MTDIPPQNDKHQWETQSMGKTSSENEKIGTQLLDDEAVILVNGDNMFGDKVYSYIKFTLKNFRAMREAMQKGENFKPSDYGEVIAAGRGEPSQELKDEMRVQWGLVDTPKPEKQGIAPQGLDKPQLFDEDDGF